MSTEILTLPGAGAIHPPTPELDPKTLEPHHPRVEVDPKTLDLHHPRVELDPKTLEFHRRRLELHPKTLNLDPPTFNPSDKNSRLRPSNPQASPKNPQAPPSNPQAPPKNSRPNVSPRPDLHPKLLESHCPRPKLESPTSNAEGLTLKHHARTPAHGPLLCIRAAPTPAFMQKTMNIP